MLFWKAFNCSIFISSQNSVIFPMPYFSALYLVWWQQENLGSLEISFIFTGMDRLCAGLFLLGDLPWSISDISQGTVSQIEVSANGPRWRPHLYGWKLHLKFLLQVHPFKKKLWWYKVSFATPIPPNCTLQAVGRATSYLFCPHGKINLNKKEMPQNLSFIIFFRISYIF